MNLLLETAADVQSFLEKRGWEFCIIGGVAANYWGEPRATRDVDLTLLSGFGGEEPFVKELLDEFSARRADPFQFALAHRIVLLQHRNGTPIDIALGAIPFEASAVSRARKVEVSDGVRLKLCTAEDLIVFKAFAGRVTDWRDVEGVISKQPENALNWKYIEAHLKPLADLKEQPEIMTELRRIRERVRKLFASGKGQNETQ